MIQKKLIRKVFREFGLFPFDKSLEGVIQNLDQKYGFTNSKFLRKPVDVSNNPLPWFTYPAIEYISQLDLSQKRIFEWGSGNSSRFFASRCQEILSIESDKEWYSYGKLSVLHNQKILFREEPSFAESIDESSDKFDVIIIDAIRRHDCALKAVKHLKHGGIIILDNSERHPKTSEFLRSDCNLIEIDMHGFGPINDYSWTTSIYLHRDFRFTPRYGIQPVVSRAGIHEESKT